MFLKIFQTPNFIDFGEVLFPIRNVGFPSSVLCYFSYFLILCVIIYDAEIIDNAEKP